VAALFCLAPIHGSEEVFTFQAPATGYGGHTLTLVWHRTGAAEEKPQAAWLFAKSDTVVAQGKAPYETKGEISTLALKFPEVERPVALDLHLTITSADRPLHAMRPIWIVPADWARQQAGSFTEGCLGSFDEKSLAGQLGQLGFKPETFTSELGLSAFKGNVLIVSASMTESGLDLYRRLEERVRGGLGVLVLAPAALSMPPLKPARLERLALREPELLTEAWAWQKQAQDRPEDPARAALFVNQAFAVPEEGPHRVLCPAGRDAGVLEVPQGRGRWVIVSVNLVERSLESPADFALLFGLLKHLAEPRRAGNQ
jgi:hypothetical protein